jgi:hypothetical protein
LTNQRKAKNRTKPKSYENAQHHNLKKPTDNKIVANNKTWTQKSKETNTRKNQLKMQQHRQCQENQ